MSRAMAVHAPARLRAPRWFGPTARYVGVYVAVLGIATFALTKSWHTWDWMVYAKVSALRAPAFSNSIVVLDLLDAHGGRSADRRTIARILDTLRSRRQIPSAVLIDLDFASLCAPELPCPPDASTAALRRALGASKLIPVYVAANDDGKGAFALLDRRSVYDEVASGHTMFQATPSADTVVYRRCYLGKGLPLLDASGGAPIPQDAWFLPYRVATSLSREPLPSCEAEAQHVDVVRLGPHADFERSVHAITATSTLPALNFRDQYLIIAAQGRDDGKLLQQTGRTNPELLAWALSNLVSAGSAKTDQLRPAGDILIALVIVFTLVMLLVFAAAFQTLRRAAFAALRGHEPWLAATVAIVVTVLLFTGLEALLFAREQIQPQVSLLTFAVVMGGAICAKRGREILDDEDALDPGSSAPVIYDAFISYASEDRAWVVEELLAPLGAVTLRDGSNLRVFFDQDPDAIRIASRWKRTLSKAIRGSNHVVAALSSSYFLPQKHWCRAELELALSRRNQLGSDTQFLICVKRDKVHIPDDFALELAGIQAPTLAQREGLIDEVVRTIVASAERSRSS
jgi:hypothetical protein